MMPVVRMMSPDLNGGGIATCLIPMIRAPPLASTRLMYGSLLIPDRITRPVRSKLSPVRCAKMYDMTSVQFVSITANMAHMKFMGALCQISGMFSSVNGKASTHPFGCVVFLALI